MPIHPETTRIDDVPDLIHEVSGQGLGLNLQSGSTGFETSKFPVAEFIDEFSRWALDASRTHVAYPTVHLSVVRDANQRQIRHTKPLTPADTEPSGQAVTASIEVASGSEWSYVTVGETTVGNERRVVVENDYLAHTTSFLPSSPNKIIGAVHAAATSMAPKRPDADVWQQDRLRNALSNNKNNDSDNGQPPETITVPQHEAEQIIGLLAELALAGVIHGPENAIISAAIALGDGTDLQQIVMHEEHPEWSGSFSCSYRASAGTEGRVTLAYSTKITPSSGGGLAVPAECWPYTKSLYLDARAPLVLPAQ